MIGRARSRGLPTTSITAALLTTFLVAVTSVHAGTLTVAWDPSPDPSVIGYRVYVGTTSGAYTETYDVGNATTFSYNGTEGARYYFAVAAYASGPVVGPRSNAVDAWAGPGDAPSFWSSVWAARATSSRRHTVGSGTERTLLAESNDGRQFFVDAGRRVRAITGKGLARESVLIADRSTTLHHVAVDPTFDASGWIWVSETQMSADGPRTFAVVRYRVVRNRAGERAEIISGITLPPSGNALFAIGESGHIYVAVPGSAGSQPYWGMVLRFNPDGSVPEGHLSGSPVVGTGYTFPHAITVDRFSERVLLSGAD